MKTIPLPNTCRVEVYQTGDVWSARSFAITDAHRSLDEDARRSAADGVTPDDAALTAAAMHLGVARRRVALARRGEGFVATVAPLTIGRNMLAFWIVSAAICWVIFLAGCWVIANTLGELFFAR
jgi:hypothetical protein